MRLNRELSCDVIVLGSGIAGISAALEAAEAGCSVVLLSKGRLFSGSSFYPGTWGLGLIGPDGEHDEADLAKTIHEVGCGVADPEMVGAFVSGIHPAIEKIRSMGVALRRADQGTQKEYIPCFDHKHRDWNGIEFDSVREVFTQKLDALGVTIFAHCEAMELVQRTDQSVCGVVVVRDGALHYLGCKTLILATGGYGSIFKHHLCTDDVAGNGQYMAMRAGCELVNMEFMQMMPGYISPAYQTVFNEKAFRFTKLSCVDGKPLLSDDESNLLDLRSTHGPFTSRLPSKTIDLSIFRSFMEDERGVKAVYTDDVRKDPPEFVQTYFEWLQSSKGLTMDDPVFIGMFAHAANGGIRIHTDTFTGIPCLFAAGEVTGGMHGADRIGGLSTANGLVFGGKAGRAAAAACFGVPEPPDHFLFDARASGETLTALNALRDTMFQNAMVVRNEDGLLRAISTVDGIRRNLKASVSEDVPSIARTYRLEGRLYTAQAVLQSALLRKESRGSHYRSDYPEQNPALEKPIFVKLNSETVCARFAAEG